MLRRCTAFLLRVPLLGPSSSQVRSSNLVYKFRDFTMSSVNQPQANSDVKSTDSTPTESQAVVEASADLTSEATAEPELSKSARKRIAKELKWKEGLEQRREIRREKRKARRQNPCDDQKRVRPILRKEVVHTGVNIVFDMSYDDEMTKMELQKVRNQLQHSYGFNRRQTHQAAVHFTSYRGRMKAEMQRGAPGVENWDCTFTEKPYDAVFDKDQIVYLTSESPNVLTSLDKGKAYIVGALVDHNAKKGISYERALEKGLAHAKLPIAEHIHMPGRFVLSIPHVLEILVRYLNTRDWTSSLMESIPDRKKAVLLEGSGGATAGTSTEAAESTSAPAAAAVSMAEQEAEADAEAELASSDGNEDSEQAAVEDGDTAAGSGSS